jgi:hypothetical protein
MHRALESKWRVAAGLALAMALVSDMTAKHFAGEAMISVAKSTAGVPSDVNPRLQVHLSNVAVCVGIGLAIFALVCWGISAFRLEPGSSLMIVILVVLYGFSFLIVV